MILGITSIQRDRAPWIAEWIAFHYVVGFERFYIYLHRCSDETEKVLNGLQKKVDIRINAVSSEWDPPQIGAYEHSCQNFLPEVDWMAFIDADEFLFSTFSTSMKLVLKGYENKNISALGAYWRCFGSSGHLSEPKGLITENYTRRARDNYSNNQHIKSIVRGRKNRVRTSDPHLFSTEYGTFDENLRRITYGLTKYSPSYKKLCINHYATQSREYFVNFKSKYQTPDNGFIPDESFWQEHDQNDIIDNSMKKYIQSIKEFLDLV